MSKEKDVSRDDALIKGRDLSPGSNLIRCDEDIRKIKYPSEQAFALFILRKNPHLIISYEPQRFEYRFKDGQTKATLPDFLIINPLNSNKSIYVEITCSKRGLLYDVKERQKMVMKNAAPQARYVVFYEHNLRNMMRKHPGVNLLPKLAG